jgi:type I restriction enzyme S subunit
MKSNYKRIGDYIKEVKVRNSELKAQKLLGINIDKFFMPSVANVVGTDMSVYKIVKKNQFACNRMHVGRDYRLPVSMSKTDEEFMVSPAYDVFEILDTDILTPEYLMMWFTRREFDRNAWFYTDADVRGGLHWKALCDMQLPIPHPDKQREIVKEYNTIQNRIDLNQQLIQKLDETAQAIYREWFVEGIDLENLPEGWIKSKIGIEVETLGGGTPSTEIEEYWKEGEIFWYSPTDIKNVLETIYPNFNLFFEIHLPFKHIVARLFLLETFEQILVFFSDPNHLSLSHVFI